MILPYCQLRIVIIVNQCFISGYANEVGEAFRSQVHVNVVRASYGVASAYVVADAIHKGSEAARVITNHLWTNNMFTATTIFNWTKLSLTAWGVLSCRGAKL